MQEAPKFAVEEADLDLGDDQMLPLIGPCVSLSGPLSGRSLQRMGRADMVDRRVDLTLPK